MSNGDPAGCHRQASNRDAWFTINQGHWTNTANHVAGLKRCNDCIVILRMGFIISSRHLWFLRLAGFACAGTGKGLIKDDHLASIIGFTVRMPLIPKSVSI